MLCPPVLVLCFGGLFVWVVSRLAGDRPMSPKFRKVTQIPKLCCQLPTNFYNISIVLLSELFERLVSVRLG